MYYIHINYIHPGNMSAASFHLGPCERRAGLPPLR